MAAAVIVEDGRWLGRLQDELRTPLAPVFAQARSRFTAFAYLGALQRFILDHLADPQAVLVLDETAGLKKGQMTVGVARQHAGITGQVENCQTVVNCAYVTACGHALYDFRFYLPEAWCQDGQAAGAGAGPRDVEFKTKTELGGQMVTGAIGAGTPGRPAAAKAAPVGHSR